MRFLNNKNKKLNIIITNGKNSVSAYINNIYYLSYPNNIRIKNENGAGDTLCAVFNYFYCNNYDILESLNKRKSMSEIIGKINQKNFSKLDFDNFSKNKSVPIQKISLEGINDTKVLEAGAVNQIYNFPEKKVSASYNIQLTENFLVYINKIIDVSVDENSDEYKKYFKLAKISITNELFNTYDKYIKEKYEIDINYKALKTVKDYFN